MKLFDLIKKHFSGSAEPTINNSSPRQNSNYRFNQIASPDSELATVRVLERISHNGIIMSCDPNDYPKWFEYDFGIKDPYKKLNELISMGYIHKVPVEIALKKRKVSELQEELNRQGLPSKGKKDDLIKRLVEEGTPSAPFVPEVVELTDKGNEYLKVHEENLFAGSLQRFSISLKDYYDEKGRMSQNSSREEIVISILLKKQYSSGLDFWIYYDIQKELAQLYYRTGDNSTAMLHYIAAAYYSCCTCAKLIDSETDIIPELSNAIYSLKGYFVNDMIDFCTTLPVTDNGSSGRYNINYFKKQIYSIVK